MKRDCLSKASWRRSKVVLRTAASFASSLSFDRTSIRRERLEAEMVSAVAAISSMGRTVRLTMNQAPTRPIAVTALPTRGGIR